ncbi:MAG: mechanosensitive ion channel domain-containing protein [Nanobdellota archaeon]
MNNTTSVVEPLLIQSSDLISSLTVAFIIFVLGLILGSVLGRIVERLFQELNIGPVISKKTGVSISFEKLVKHIVSYGIYIVFFILALNRIGITAIILDIIAILILAFIALSFFFLLKDSVPNILAYRKLSSRKDISVGNHISIQNIEGEIIDLNLFEIQVKTSSGDVIHIPNSLLLKEIFSVSSSKK